MKKTKPNTGNNLPVTVTYKNGKKHISFNISNTKLEDWVDKEVIQKNLYISSRTLQSLRSGKKIPYSTLGGKIFYYLPGILKLFEQNLFA